MQRTLTYFLLACSIILFNTSCDTETTTVERQNPVDRTSWANTDNTISLEFTSGEEAVLTVLEASGSVNIVYSYEYVVASYTAELRYATEEYPDFDAVINSGTITLTNLSTGQTYTVLYPQ
ncbi:MAG: hypothetical protein R3Y59_02985 [bacterium]